MYQPELGRFLQPDPKQFEAGDYNIYRYCNNDPIDKNDPLGLEDFRIFNAKDNAEQPIYDDGPGTFDLGDHGRDGYLFDADGLTVITAQMLLDRVKVMQSFQDAKIVKFWVCDAGKGDNPIAKQFAELSGKRTLAPNTTFFPIGPKGLVAPETKPGSDKPSRNLLGRWFRWNWRHFKHTPANGGKKR